MNNRKHWVCLIFAVMIMVCVWLLLIWSSQNFSFKEAIFIWLRIIAYHVIIRILVGIITNHLPLGAYHPSRFWYKSRPWEKKLYQILRVKNWKNYLPIFDVRKWDMHEHSISDILRFGCQAEVAHFGNVVLSICSVFFPEIFGLTGEKILFFPGISGRGLLLFTGVTAAIFDSLFILIQRYNRPRFQKILEKIEGTKV